MTLHQTIPTTTTASARPTTPTTLAEAVDFAFAHLEGFEFHDFLSSVRAGETLEDWVKEVVARQEIAAGFAA